MTDRPEPRDPSHARTDTPSAPHEAQLVLVDSHDVQTGIAGRAACHVPGGLRHRAFSVYLFDEAGRLLVQRRHATKPLWPGYWSNSVCSHPRPGEPVLAAAERRVREELGVEAELTPCFVYEYRADYVAERHASGGAERPTVGTEHEVVHVFIGQVDADAVRANPTEVAAWRMQSIADLDAALEVDTDVDPHEADAYTPWFQKAWPRVRSRLQA